MEANSDERFRSALYYPVKEDTIVLVGLGGIGSWTNLALSRLLTDTTLILYDDDRVDPGNTGGQLYRLFDARSNAYKTKAATEIGAMFSGYKNYFIVRDKYDSGGDTSPIMFSAVDNMETRKVIYENWKSQENRELLIDGRMTAHMWQVYAVTPDNEERYVEEALFPQEEGSSLLCSLQQTTHTAMMMGAAMVNPFTAHLTNRNVGTMVCRIPYHTEYHTNTFRYEINY